MLTLRKTHVYSRHSGLCNRAGYVLQFVANLIPEFEQQYQNID